jgi:hypothetical protein
MFRLSFALVTVTMIAAPVAAAPKQCRNPTTKQFMKCPPVAAPAIGGVTKDKNGKCHVATGKNKGKFTKCP